MPIIERKSNNQQISCMALNVSVKFECFILLVWLQLVSAEIPTNASRPITKPGCQDSCGINNIPYPFGIGEGCFLEKWVEISCDNSIPFDQRYPLLYGGIYVSNISILDGYMVTAVPISIQCSINGQSNHKYWSGNIGKFTFSDTNNKLIAIGCNTYAYLELDGGASMATATGCMSICNKVEDATSGSCSGFGCCEASIPKNFVAFNITVGSLSGLRTNFSLHPCTYAFFIEKNSFDYNYLPYLKDFKNNGTGMVPAAIDWTIGTETCEEAERNPTSYACGPNTICVQATKSQGYRCDCKSGYKGNPYLNLSTGGHCQDVDECQASSTPCGTLGTCTNTEGGYKCDCPPGSNLVNITYGYGYPTIVYCDFPGKHRIPIVAVVLSAIGGCIVIIVILGVGYWLYNRFQKRKQMKLKQDHFTRNGGLLLNQKIISNEGGVERAAKIFVAEELEKTTDNFNPSRIIGKGGYGTVFKGMLSNGEIVAIKKSTLVDETQVGQFINEVAILSQINHRHIVRLLGCCLETHVPLLVYEFVSNGTLSYHLHVEDGDHESLISWKDRVRIASEIAGALAYLHSDASMPIFHRDIKSTNILLDEKYKAKVSDFGISRSAHVDSTHLTTRVQGTFGYLDPEYFHSGQFTDKSDVYSFGIVLVELLTGEQALSQVRHGEEKSLALYFTKSVKENRLSETLDARVFNEGNPDDVLVVGKLAKKCLNYVGKKRPTMKEASLCLGGLHEKLSKDAVQP